MKVYMYTRVYMFLIKFNDTQYANEEPPGSSQGSISAAVERINYWSFSEGGWIPELCVKQ